MQITPFPALLGSSPLGPGERLITVRSDGLKNGVPVLIRENPDGTAHVVAAGRGLPAQAARQARKAAGMGQPTGEKAKASHGPAQAPRKAPGAPT